MWASASSKKSSARWKSPCRRSLYENSHHRPAHGGQDLPVHDPDRRPPGDAHRLHGRAHGRGQSARRAPGSAGPPVRAAQSHPRHGGIRGHAVRSPRRTCATPATWPACAWWTPSPTCCACSRTRPSRTRRARSIPLRDLEDVETELILSDLVVVEKRLERLDKDRKKIKNPELDREFELLEQAAKPRSKTTSRCANWNSTPRTKSAFAASSSSRRSPCSTC